MTRDNQPSLTRRHLLTSSTLGLIGLTGCIGNTPYTRSDDTTPTVTPPPFEDTEPDGNYWDDTPRNQPITFNSTVEYSYRDLSTLEDLPTEILTSYNEYSALRNHPPNTYDGRIIIEDDETAHARILNAKVADPLTVILYLRDKDHTFHRKTTTLTPPSSDEYTTHKLTFDISDVSLPTQAGGYALLCIQDPDEDDDEDERFITHHQFVRIPYKDGTYYVNDHTLATYMYQTDIRVDSRDPYGVNLNGRVVNEYSVPAGTIYTEDDETGRTVFLVARHTETKELMGASCYVKHDPIERWDNGGNVDNKNSYRHKHRMIYEARFATDLDFLKELAHSTHDAVTNLGLTTPFEKLSALADFVQMIPYESDHLEPPSVVVYKTHGDCETKSHLLGGILQNDPWNVNHAYVFCYVKNVDYAAHEVVGIAEDELDGMPADLRANTPLYSFPKNKQRNGFPTDKYALVDVTSDWTIGDSSNLEDIEVRWLAGYSDRNRGTSTKKPDY